MATEKNTFSSTELSNWVLLRWEFKPIPCAYCALALGLSACTTLPDITLQYKDGVLYGCVFASALKNEGDRCYKVVPKEELPNGIKTPE
jgi:hypothetical protein